MSFRQTFFSALNHDSATATTAAVDARRGTSVTTVELFSLILCVTPLLTRRILQCLGFCNNHHAENDVAMCREEAERQLTAAFLTHTNKKGGPETALRLGDGSVCYS